MKKYEKMKSSNVFWLGDIPEHWEQYRGKRLFYSQKVKNIGNEEKNILSLTLKGVIRNNADKPIGLSPSDYSTYQIFEKDDLVFKLIDLNNISTSRVGLVPERGIMSSAYIRLTARHECNIRYFFLQYYDLWLRNIYNGLGAGVRQTLSVDDLLELEIVVPPREEQDRIVRFLDWKVSEINRLIQCRKRQIERLEELKKAVVSRAVTRGLNPDAGMKNSGVNWIGDIPEHWEIEKIKHLFSERVEKGHPEETLLVSSQNMGVVPKSVYGNRTVEALKDLHLLKLVRKGDFVISLRSFQGGIEYAYYQGIISPAYTIMINNETAVSSDYFKYLAKSKRFIELLQMCVTGIREGQNIDYKKLKNNNIPIPPIEEQQQIAAYLDEQMKKIDSAIANKQKQIETLQELKTRLISDVVTGKIDVRGIEIPEYEYTAEEADTDSEAEAEELDEGGEEI